MLQQEGSKTLDVKAWKPRYLFVYGSLMDPDWTQEILDRPDTPQMTDARITGFQIKMWGPYPTLLALPGNVVRGKVFMLENEEEERRLEHYETDVYELTQCLIDIGGVGEVAGYTFIWSEPEDTEDLEDGCFDLEEWKRGRL